MNPFDMIANLRKKDNPFQELSSAEKLKRKRQEIEVKEGIKRLGIICADLVNDQRYREFADVFKDISRKLTDLLINCDVEDRDKFYLKIKEYQFKIRMFNQILKMPHEFIDSAEEIKKDEQRSV